MRLLALNRIKEKSIVRNGIIIFLIIDTIIFSIFAFCFKIRDNFQFLLVKQTLLLSFPGWILINYLNNRYHNYIKNFTATNLIKSFSRITLNYLILNLITIVITYSYSIDLNYYVYAKKLLFISLFSFLFEIIIKHFFNKSNNVKKYLFVGDHKKYEMLKLESSKAKIIDFLDYKDIKISNNLIKNK